MSTTSGSQGRRIAHVVLPIYNWSALGDPTITDTLENCGLLPSSLSSYAREIDCEMFEETLKPLGFSVDTLVGSLTASDFKTAVQRLVHQCSSPADVLVLVFCGHGHQELFTRHASLVFSDNKRVSSVWLDRHLSASCTPATVYLVLNCCTADGVNMALPQGSVMAPVGQPATDIAACGWEEPNLAGMRRIDIFSTSCTERQKGSRNGTLFAKAFHKVLASGSEPVPVRDLERRLRQAMAALHTEDDCAMASVKTYGHTYGSSLGPVCEDSKVREKTVKRLSSAGQLFEAGDFPWM